MKIITILFFCISAYNLCRVSSNFVYPTIEESYELSGAVLQGTVDNFAESEVLKNKEIYLKDVTYYKGCGPRRVKISGYSSGSRCSIYPPRTGKKIIVFVCKDPDSDSWILHRYKPYAGQFLANTKHMRRLNNYASPNESCNYSNFEYGTCRRA